MTTSTTRAVPYPDAPTRRASGTQPGSRGAGRQPTELAAVVEAGLHAMNDLRFPRPEVTSGDLEVALRIAVERQHQRVIPESGPEGGRVAEPGERLAKVAAAVRVACAHLGAGNLVEAHLALRSAHETLPRRDRRDAAAAVRAVTRVRATDVTIGRALGDRTVVAQAVGVISGETGTDPSSALSALRAHATRQRFVLRELAADVVAGRMASAAIVTGDRRSRRRTARPGD